MGALSRFKDIMSANINAMLEKAESKNADKILENYIRQAKEDLDDVKSETAAIIAEETAAKRKLDDIDNEMEKLSKYAEQAIIAGNDNDARKFLEGKAKAAEKKEDALKNYELAQQNSKRMKDLTKKLMEDIEEADAKLGELKSKLAVAKQTEKLNALNEKFSSSGSGLSNYDSLADAVQRRIDAADAKAALNKELDADSDLDDLMSKYDSAESSSSSIDDELAALKAKLGK